MYLHVNAYLKCCNSFVNIHAADAFKIITNYGLQKNKTFICTVDLSFLRKVIKKMLNCPYSITHYTMKVCGGADV